MPLYSETFFKTKLLCMDLHHIILYIYINYIANNVEVIKEVFHKQKAVIKALIDTN